MKSAFTAAVLAVAAPCAAATGIDVNLSSQALRGVYAAPLADVLPRLNGVYEMGFLLGEEENRNYQHVHGGLLATGDAGARSANVIAGLGGRIAALNVEDVDITGGALALGGMVEGRLPAFNRIGAILYAYAAPKASAFGDLEGYLDYAVGVDYQVLREASLYVGYRQVKIDLKGVGDVTVDNGWHVGLRLNF